MVPSLADAEHVRADGTANVSSRLDLNPQPDGVRVQTGQTVADDAARTNQQNAQPCWIQQVRRAVIDSGRLDDRQRPDRRSTRLPDHEREQIVSAAGRQIVIGRILGLIANTDGLDPNARCSATARLAFAIKPVPVGVPVAGEAASIVSITC